MAKKEVSPQFDNKEESTKGKELNFYMSDIWRGFHKFWWLCVLLAVVFALAFGVLSFLRFTPKYSVSATFTVQTQEVSTSGGGITTYSYYYSRTTAEQLSDTFPYILESNLLQSAVCEDLGVPVMPTSISATSVTGTNMFTMTATGRDAQSTYDVLVSAMKNYPSVAEYVIGSSQLVMISEPILPEAPSNSRNTVLFVALGFVLGTILGCAWIAVYVLTRDTIRTKKDLTEKVNIECLGIIPKVTFKKYNKMVDNSVLITNRLTGDSFLETVRQFRNAVVSEMGEDKKAIMVTSTAPDEGKTTIALNLAIAMAQMEKKVIIVDGDLRNPSVAEQLKDVEGEELYNSDSNTEIRRFPSLRLDSLRFTVQEKDMWKIMRAEYLDNCIKELKKKYDCIIVDAPPCALVSDPITIAEAVDSTVLVIKQDTVRTTRIRYALENLHSVNAHIMGCVLNAAGSGITGYGYYYGGYGYAYNRYGYKKYGYGYGYRYGKK